MGRLTLNVLLSFAQFEREVTSERIRDKIAASKRKGLWVGGNLPLGYKMMDGKVAIVEEEAELVRSIFRRYLELGSVNELLRDLRESNIRTKSRLLSTGATRGGIPFGRGALYYLLGNHFYIGEVKYKNEILPGEQPPIMDRALFEAVRQKSLAQWSHRTVMRNKSDHLLTGLLFDDAGHRMVPTHATKAGIRYRYYVSAPVLHGEARTASAGSVSRVPAPDVEDVIVMPEGASCHQTRWSNIERFARSRNDRSVGRPDRCATETGWSFSSNQMTHTKHPIPQTTCCFQFLGGSHLPKDLVRSWSRTAHRDATFGPSSSSAARGWSAPSPEVVGGWMMSSRVG